MQILFHNDYFILVDKLPGWLSVPSRLREGDPRRCVGLALQQELGERVWPLHRLDIEVSGLLLFACDPTAQQYASDWFAGGRVRKGYEAWTEGEEGEGGEWKSLLLRGKKKAYESEGGKESVTRAACLGKVSERGITALAWRLEPLTGRPHQLRYELAKRDRPVLGDALYGAKTKWKLGGIALRAISLDLTRCHEANQFGLPNRFEVNLLADLVREKL